MKKLTALILFAYVIIFLQVSVNDATLKCWNCPYCKKIEDESFEVKEVIPPNSEVKEVIPPKSEVKEVIPPKSEVKEVIPPKPEENIEQKTVKEKILFQILKYQNREFPLFPWNGLLTRIINSRGTLQDTIEFNFLQARKKADQFRTYKFIYPNKYTGERFSYISQPLKYYLYNADKKFIDYHDQKFINYHSECILLPVIPMFIIFELKNGMDLKHEIKFFSDLELIEMNTQELRKNKGQITQEYFLTELNKQKIKIGIKYDETKATWFIDEVMTYCLFSGVGKTYPLCFRQHFDPETAKTTPTGMTKIERIKDEHDIPLLTHVNVYHLENIDAIRLNDFIRTQEEKLLKIEHMYWKFI
jgi:hypothetical protein